MTEPSDPSQFYTGIVAELYAPLRSAAPDPEPYAQFISVAGEPALELGCGGGDPLLELRRRGIDVEGVDASADMLDRCRRAAAEESIDVVVHHQKMEELDLPRRYRSIFLAGPSFNLLTDDDTAARALGRIRSHLAEGGSALIPLFIPARTPIDQLGEIREATDAEGASIRVSTISEERDETHRIQKVVLRYERVTADEHTIVERPWTLHWHTQEGFQALASGEGLTIAAILDAQGKPAPHDAETFAFWLQAA